MLDNIFTPSQEYDYHSDSTCDSSDEEGERFPLEKPIFEGFSQGQYKFNGHLAPRSDSEPKFPWPNKSER